MLALVLAKARALDLERVMLPVRDENLASVRVIVNNGGVMERSGVALDAGEIVSLYWITL